MAHRTTAMTVPRGADELVREAVANAERIRHSE